VYYKLNSSNLQEKIFAQEKVQQFISMDALTFFSKLIDAVAWPAVVLIVLFVVRKELPEIIRTLRKFKFKDFEIEFGEAAKAVASEARDFVSSNPQNIQIGGEATEDSLMRLRSIADLAPRAAILESWLKVEVAAVDVIRRHTNTSLTSMPGPMRLRDHLIRAEVLNKKQIEIFENLRELRNQAVHFADAQFTREAVESYIDAALMLATYLEGLASKND
jgi:hypothetical protein